MSEQHLLDVAEIFVSLQGEGPFPGQPATFIRLAGCVPPFCSWCDTPHALHANHEGVRRMAPEELLSKVEQTRHELVVITGGEPFLQWDNGLSELDALLTVEGRRVQYETSGKAGIPALNCGFVVCSPKPAHVPQLAPELIPRVDAFKFVVDDDIEPILHFVRSHAIEPPKVWLMPLGATRQEQTARMPEVWEQCVRHGFNFASRLHILTFDDKKGV